MWQQRARIVQQNIEVLIVSFEEAEHALNYQQEEDIGWPIVVDRTRELYDYYGMNKASFWDLWGWASLKAYFREIMKGNMPKRAHDDIHQRGGDVLLDPKGKVRLHHIGKGPGDRPDIEEVLAIVEHKNSGQEEFGRYKN